MIDGKQKGPVEQVVELNKGLPLKSLFNAIGSVLNVEKDSGKVLELTLSEGTNSRSSCVKMIGMFGGNINGIETAKGELSHMITYYPIGSDYDDTFTDKFSILVNGHIEEEDVTEIIKSIEQNNEGVRFTNKYAIEPLYNKVLETYYKNKK